MSANNKSSQSPNPAKPIRIEINNHVTRRISLVSWPKGDERRISECDHRWVTNYVPSQIKLFILTITTSRFVDTNTNLFCPLISYYFVLCIFSWWTIGTIVFPIVNSTQYKLLTWNLSEKNKQSLSVCHWNIVESGIKYHNPQLLKRTRGSPEPVFTHLIIICIKQLTSWTRIKNIPKIIVIFYII
jgi:hypothetical protein